MRFDFWTCAWLQWAVLGCILCELQFHTLTHLDVLLCKADATARTSCLQRFTSEAAQVCLTLAPAQPQAQGVSATAVTRSHAFPAAK